jgi:hypothetical protein
MAEPSVGKREKVNRSPRHPSFNLGEAIRKAREFYAKERFSYAPATVAMKHLGYSAKSSSGIRAIAALLQFGLFEEEKGGSRDTRRVRLSELGRRIVTSDSASVEYESAVKEAALRPRLYRMLWQKWGPHLPSDHSMEYELVRGDWGFHPDSVPDFIKDFNATITLARLTESDKLPDGNVDVDGGETEDDDVSDPNARDEPRNPPSRREQQMPEIGRSDVAPLDLVIPLIDGGQAVLRVPRRMSSEDFTHLTEYLTHTFARLRKALTGEPGVGSSRSE